MWNFLYFCNLPKIKNKIKTLRVNYKILDRPPKNQKKNKKKKKNYC